MASIIAEFQDLFEQLRDEFESDSCFWSVVEYKDVEDGGAFAAGWNVVQVFTSDFDDVLTAINSLSAAGGGDTPEQQFESGHTRQNQQRGVVGRPRG